MIKIIKWEVAKRLHQIKIPLLVMFCLLAILVITPRDIIQGSFTVGFLCSLAVVLYFFGMCIYLMLAITVDYTKPYAIMEKSSTRTPFALIFSKLLSNFMFVVLLYVLIKAFEIVLDQIATSNIQFAKLTINPIYLFVMGFVLPLLLLFFFFLVKCFSFSSKSPAVLVCVLLFACVIMALFVVPKIPLPLFVIAGIVIGLLLLLVCSKLYDTRFEL